MSVLRFRVMYPDNIFRAVIDIKNVAPPDDLWAEGVLCTDGIGNMYILNRKAGEGVYGCCAVDMQTLGLSSNYKDGGRREIFEGDIITVERFVTDEPFLYPEYDDDGELIIPEREVYEYAPLGNDSLMKISGVVFMSGGVFYIQFYDENINALNAVPLYMFFSYDGLPLPDTAVCVTGNMYDNEDEYCRALRLNDNFNAG